MAWVVDCYFTRRVGVAVEARNYVSLSMVKFGSRFSEPYTIEPISSEVMFTMAGRFQLPEEKATVQEC